MFDFSASGQASEVRRRPALPLAASIALHAAAVTLLLALPFSDGIAEPPPAARTAILLEPPPSIHVIPRAALRVDRAAPRLFRAPVMRSVSAPVREQAALAALQVPLPEVLRPALPPAVIADLAAARPPPLRTDNFAPLAASAPSATGRAPAALRPGGFEQIAIETPPRPRAPPLSGGEFGDATLLPASRPRGAGVLPAPPVTRSVEILAKPRPAYTDEARRRRIEGEVLLQVLFAASGQVRVLRIVRGLSPGLDENAVAAAAAIRFRPAERAGVAADSTAIVHILFQLAY